MMWYGLALTLLITATTYYYRNPIYRYLKNKYHRIKTNATTAVILRAISNNNNNNSDSRFEINDNRRTATITYRHNDKLYKVVIPYNRRKIRSMSQSQVHLIKDGERVNITHQPGVPYLVSAEDMGGQAFIITNENEEIEINDCTIIPQID